MDYWIASKFVLKSDLSIGFNVNSIKSSVCLLAAQYVKMCHYPMGTTITYPPTAIATFLKFRSQISCNQQKIIKILFTFQEDIIILEAKKCFSYKGFAPWCAWGSAIIQSSAKGFKSFCWFFVVLSAVVLSAAWLFLLAAWLCMPFVSSLTISLPPLGGGAGHRKAPSCPLSV